jgi:hypothetical protein
MAANTFPIYTKEGDIQWTSIMSGASSSTDLTTGTSYLAYSADSTNGGYVQRIRFKPVNNSGVTNVATVARVWINNGDTTSVYTNNVFFDEISLPATTGTVSAALPVYELPLNFALPPGYAIYVTLGTPVVGGYRATVIGGKY